MPEIKVPSQPMSLLTFLLGPPASASFEDGTNKESFDPDHRFGSAISDVPTEPYTFRELKSYVKCFASGFIKAGLEPGDRLMLIAPESIYTPVIMYATIATGGIFTARTPSFTTEQHAYFFKHSKPKILLTSSGAMGIALAAARQAGLVDLIAFLYDGLLPAKETTEEIPTWDTLFDQQGGANYEWQTLSSKDDMEKTILIDYTSGTTSDPKGVELTHRSCIHTIALTINHLGTCSSWDAWFSTFSYAQIGAKWIGLVALKSRVQLKTWTFKEFDEQQFLASLASSHVDMLWLAKQSFDAIARAKNKANDDSVKMVFTGAQIIPKRSRDLVNNFFGGRNVVKVGFGATEASAIAIERLEDEVGESSCVGRPISGMEVKILDDQGNECAAGEEGHLYVRSQALMKGYWQNSSATCEAISKDGWLDVGDAAYLADDGRLNITGRFKEIIKVRGRSVNPHGIEETLLQMPAVEIACAVGLSSDDGEELPAAYVVPAEGHDVQEKEVHAFIGKAMNADHQLTGGIIFLTKDDVPYGGNGKVERRKLKLNAEEAYRKRKGETGSA